MSHIDIYPQDEYNAQLIANVHPPDRTNPTPAARYTLVIIGAGTAGKVAAMGAAGVGAKVAIVERGLLGGDCLNVGCVPSKAIIRSGRLVGELQAAERFGVQVPPGSAVDFGKVMERMRQVRARISPDDSVAFFESLGIDVFLGAAHFSGPDTLALDDGQTLRFKKAVIATGARPAEPPIPGLAEAGYLTNETVFSLTERPARLAVIGGGPIGCELAQAFRRLGSEVVLFHNTDHILNREDSDAAEIVQQAFVREQIGLLLNAQITAVSQRDGTKVLAYTQPDAGGKSGGEVEVDAILVATGRVPNVETLNLEAVGVAYDTRQGVHVDDRLQTTNPRIFAVGDVCMAQKFTHAADAAARIVVRNALFLGRAKLSDLTMPWCTYTDPEVAHVGLYPHEAAARGIAIDTYTVPLSRVDRAIADGADEGFVKVHTRQGSDKIVGATIVASHAGDLISEITLAMVGGLGLGTIYQTIHPYPTQAEAIRAVANAYNRTRLTPTVKKLFDFWLRLTG